MDQIRIPVQITTNSQDYYGHYGLNTTQSQSTTRVSCVGGTRNLQRTCQHWQSSESATHYLASSAPFLKRRYPATSSRCLQDSH